LEPQNPLQKQGNSDPFNCPFDSSGSNVRAELVLHKTESIQVPAIIADLGPEVDKRILHGLAGVSDWLWKESVTRFGYC
jgi:hypothetical protein